MYDKNMLKVLKKTTGSDGVMALVLLDEEALAKRSFALSPVGCEVRFVRIGLRASSV